MEMSTCTTLAVRAPRGRGNHKPAIEWRLDLPREWRRLVVTPLTIERFRDYEMAAERSIGRDEDEKPCYCSSRFVVMETRSDDDEEFYQIATYAESLKTWRLRDGRWLIHRLITREGERGSGLYSFSDRMPR
jgi:hypothetical protein